MNLKKTHKNFVKESNLLGERGPRKMRVLIPEVKPNGDYTEWRPTSVFIL